MIEAADIELKERPRVAFTQQGSRLHYAVPLALHRAGILERMYTGFFLKRGSPLKLAASMFARISPDLGRRIYARQCDEIDPSRVTPNPLFAWRVARAYPAEPIPAEFWVWTCEEFGNWMMKQGFGEANALMGFINSLDTRMLRMAQDRGLVTVGDQMGSPVAVAVREARIQSTRFPDWEPPASLVELQRLEPFVLETWASLDHFTCASEYVHDALVCQGIPADRISMIPYPVDAKEFCFVDRTRRTGPLTVGVVGTLSINKGTPYFFDVARHFDMRSVRFVAVGRSLIEPAKLRESHGHVELVGRVPRSEVTHWLEQFDVFLFPATCEGSSGAVIEAMASGLPVVTSPNSGTYARDGIEGFLCPYDDIDGMAARIRQLLDDADLRLRMGRAARARVESFDINHYSERIRSLFDTLVR